MFITNGSDKNIPCLKNAFGTKLLELLLLKFQEESIEEIDGLELLNFLSCGLKCRISDLEIYLRDLVGGQWLMYVPIINA